LTLKTGVFKPFWELANRICDDVLTLFRSRLLLFKAQTKLNLEYLIRNQRESLGATRSRNVHKYHGSREHENSKANFFQTTRYSKSFEEK